MGKKMSNRGIDLRDISTIKNLSINDLKIDATNHNNLSNKVVDEKETRRRILLTAKEMGCEKEMILLFAKYDNLMRNCTNAKEREDIGKLGALNIYRLLGGGGELYVNGQLVAKDD